MTFTGLLYQLKTMVKPNFGFSFNSVVFFTAVEEVGNADSPTAL